MVNNVRGFKSKEIMIRRIIQEENPVIMALTETKMNKEEKKVDIPGYETKRVDRDSDGGGVMMIYKKSLLKIMIDISTYKIHQAEMLWQKLDNGSTLMKLGIIYMPQESRTSLTNLKEIYKVMEDEIADARLKGNSIMIMGDLNCKVGETIKGNNQKITKGGRLLIKMIKKFKMKLVNSEECCDGLWTRIEGLKKSVLDYVIVFEEDMKLVNRMEIDEAKDITPYHVEKAGNLVEIKHTDHSMITATLNIASIAQKSKSYAMVLDSEGKVEFQKALKDQDVSSIITDDDILVTYPIWREKVTTIRDMCSKKVKIQKKWKVCRKLTAVKKRITKELKGDIDSDRVKELKERRKLIMMQIEDEEHKKENARISRVIEDIRKDGGVNSTVFWDVMRKLNGKRDDTAHAVINKEGIKCENPEEIKKVHVDWFKELLTTNEGVSELEKQAEEIVEIAWRSMEAISNSMPPRRTNKRQVEEIIKNLDPKKSKDATSWKNGILIDGGDEMAISLTNIINKVDRQKVIPYDWQKMEIKALHKNGNRCVMGNKRGLFLPNNVSKVYERVVKGRNDEDFREGITEWATGGVSRRAPIDNVMMTTSVLEQNKYMKCRTYLVFTDAEKCFDKLWLKDGIFELWRCGTDVRDCVMIKKLNEKAEVVVKTAVGDTEPFYLNDIVRQGTVYGPQICIASMDKINIIGKDVTTYYGPSSSLRSFHVK